MAQAASRKGDPDITHCSQPFREGAAKTVFVNGRGWSRQGDLNTPHLLPAGDKCVTHTAPIAKGSLTVIVEGQAAGRQGDPIASCTVVGEGSRNVLCG
tara:strand:+ start:359 stop:652 length:294 start_codon:yes stop_codon:yes gene_type:complete